MNVGGLIISDGHLDKKKEKEAYKERCQDCAYLVENEKGDWFCDNSELKCFDVEDDKCALYVDKGVEAE